MEGIFSYKTKVDISDVGENNKLSNKAILRLMQESAALHSASIGYGLNDTTNTHLAWIILNWKLQVFSRPNWNTNLVVNTWSKPIEKLYCYRDFEIYDNEDNLVAIASSKWILIDICKATISRPPKDMNFKYRSIDKSVFNSTLIEKLKEPINSKLAFEYSIQRRDVDTNHHVNNLFYLDFAYDTLPEEVFNNVDFKNVEIMYKHEAKLGEIIHCYYSNFNNEYTIIIKNSSNSSLHAIIKLSE